MAKYGERPVTPLNAKQIKFVNEYQKDGSAKLAAIRAGYPAKSAGNTGSWLLADPRIKDILNLVNEEKMSQMGVTKERVLQELASIAFANIKDILVQDSDGNTVVSLDRLKYADAAGISEITISTAPNGIQTAKIKMADKNTALEKLGKHLSLFKDQLEISGKVDLLQLVEASLSVKSIPQPDPGLIEGEYEVVSDDPLPIETQPIPESPLDAE